MTGLIDSILLMTGLIDSMLFLFNLKDLKGEKQRAQMGAARAILEKSTMMLLPSCKVRLLFHHFSQIWD